MTYKLKPDTSAELSLWLDAYDDIYSDFDSRRYLKRRISEDFVQELKMSLKYRNDQPGTLVLLLPAALRKTDLEQEIIASITMQVLERFSSLQRSTLHTLMLGLILFFGGMAILVTSSLIAFKYLQGYLPVLLRILFEPAGWFMIWNGLDFLLYQYRKVKREQNFYRKLSRMNIRFRDI